MGAKIDGKNVDMSYVLDHDAEVEFIDIDSPEGEDIVRHSTAHLMAQTILRCREIGRASCRERV